MKKFSLTWVAIAFSISLSFSQTKLILLGNFHLEAVNMNRNNYEKIIDSVKPDVILFELDSTTMTQTFEFKKEMIDFIANARNEEGKQYYYEIYPVMNYKNKHPETIIRPFDITNRDKIHTENKYYEQQDAFFSELDTLLKNKSALSFENYIIAKHYYNIVEINELPIESDYRTLNSQAVDDAVNFMYDWEENYFLKLVQSTPSLNKFEDFIKFRTSFWKQRNEAMIRNILKYTEVYKDKKILILTGSQHRYYLKKGLKPLQNKLKFTLKEYYEK